MHWLVVLLLSPTFVLMRVLGFLTGQTIRMRGWQMVLVSLVVYGGIVTFALR